jgi:hypothetical protein
MKTIRFFTQFFVIVIALSALAGAAYGAEFTVTLSATDPTSPSPSPSPTPVPNPTPAAVAAPTGTFSVSATISGNANSIDRVVFYKNDVPYAIDTASPYQMTQLPLGQDTFTYRARAYDSSGHWEDSNEFRLVVQTPNVFTMGVSELAPSDVSTGGVRNYDHTDEIKAAIQILKNAGGGTLVFPCTIPPGTGQGQAYYSIRDTINIPSDITLQSESGEQLGKCRIYWHQALTPLPSGCTTNPNLIEKPMFRVQGGARRVRFRDMWLFSRSMGDENCWPRTDMTTIAGDETVAIELNTERGPCEERGCPDQTGDVKDVIIENVAIDEFTYGIKATSRNSHQELTEHEISNVRIRGYKPALNYRQLSVDSKYAYDWDVQNFNITGMGHHQGGIEILNAGYKTSYTGLTPGLKFTHLNCNGNMNRTTPPDFCVDVFKHGGLYFRMLHSEGTPTGVDVNPLGEEETNPDPIIMESSVASGNFEDGSMQLYLIGSGLGAPNKVPFGLDDGRMRFKEDGVNADVFDCGDIHYDWTDTRPVPSPSPTPTKPDYKDLRMLYSHAERNRGGLYAFDGDDVEYPMPHTYCPANIKNYGALFFDNGVMPTQPFDPDDIELMYAVRLDPKCKDVAQCLEDLMEYQDAYPYSGRSVYIPAGNYIIERTVHIPKGVVITGETYPDGTPRVTLTLTGEDQPLFYVEIIVTPSGNTRVSNIILRNLNLDASTKNGTTGVSWSGSVCNSPPTCDVGVSSDFFMNRISFTGFRTGFFAGRDDSAYASNPMIDGVGVKDVSFYNNGTAVKIDSSNISNWNVMDVKMETADESAYGWDQNYGGHIGIQDVSCEGSDKSIVFEECIKLNISTIFINDLKKTQFVVNGLTVGAGGTVFGPNPTPTPPEEIETGQYEAYIPTSIVIRNSDLTASENGPSNVIMLGRANITTMNNKYENFIFGDDNQAKISRVTTCGDDPDEPYGGLDKTYRNLWVWSRTNTLINCGPDPFDYDDTITMGGQAGDIPMSGNIYHNVQDDYIIYRTSNHKFLIHESGGGLSSQSFAWGVTGDQPIVGRFFASNTSQVGIVREMSTGASQWWINDPNNGSNNAVWGWGLPGDIPVVGNFLDDTLGLGGLTEDRDEIAMYRPAITGGGTFWLINPRDGTVNATFSTTAVNTSSIHTGDFMGLGYDQIAQFNESNGDWVITDPRGTASTITDKFDAVANDKPVVGRFLSGSCTQVGYWRPSTERFYVRDANSTCGNREYDMLWGSNNDYKDLHNHDYPGVDDMPVPLTGQDGYSRPTVYRPTAGAFTFSVAAGQWWTHDKF